LVHQLEPAGHALFRLLGFEQGKDTLEGLPRGNPLRQRHTQLQAFFLLLGEANHHRPTVGIAQHRQHGDGDQRHQRMQAIVSAGIAQLGKLARNLFHH
jgi:hypothetical protein